MPMSMLPSQCLCQCMHSVNSTEISGTQRVGKVSVSSPAMQSAGHDAEVRTPPDSPYLVVSPNVLIAGLQPGKCSNLGCSGLSARPLSLDT